MKEVIVFKKSLGLHSTVDSATLPYSQEDGCSYLKSAINVDITDSERISRRTGCSLVAPGITTAEYQWGNKLLAVVNGNLVCYVNGLLTCTIRDAVGIRPMWFLEVGDKLFYNNGIVNGFIVGEQSYIWAPKPQTGPTTVTELAPVYPCSCMTYYKGRIFYGVEDAIWFTEAGNYLGTNLATNFIMCEGEVIMLLGLEDKLYYGTTTGVYSVTGDIMGECKHTEVLASSPIHGTGLVAESPIILGNTYPGKVGVYTARDGIYLCTEEGVTDIVKGRLVLPYGTSGSASMVNNVYTVVINN